MKCEFCHVPGYWGGWRGRSPASVADEVELLAKEFGASKILLLDDNATVGRRRMEEICKEISSRKVGAALGCLASADTFDPALMGAMLEAGFRWIHYGAESGDDRLLSSIRKRSTASETARAIRSTMDMGFRVRASWIMDLPGSTEAEIERTADMVLACAPHEVRLHHLALRLGSAIGERHAATPSTQYIHQGAQNQNLSEAPAHRVASIVEGLAGALAASGYAVVRDADEFIDLDALRARAPDLRIASLCPLRYGLGWVF